MPGTARRRLGATLLAAGTLNGALVTTATAAESSAGDQDGPVAVQVPAPVSASHLAGIRLAAGVPVPTVALPTVLDAQPGYVEQDSCDPYTKPGTKALAELLRTSFGVGGYGIVRDCHIGAASEHKEGRAVDWMVSVAVANQKAAGDAATAWLTANQGAVARRLGIQYVIWNRRMWRAYAPERGWTVYTGSSPHTDHVHISLTWDGAMRRTSWWTGAAVTRIDLGPCRVYAAQYAPIYTTKQYTACSRTLPAAPYSPYAVYSVGQKSSTIAVGQKALGLTGDGAFGAATRTAVLRYQSAKALPKTGALDKATWAKLVPTAAKPPAVTTPVTPPAQPPAQPPVTGEKSPVTTPTRPLPATLVTRITPYKSVRLKTGSTGTAVKVLQRGLAVTVTGTFASKTKAAVVALQKAYRLPQTGVVDLRTWNRLELRLFPWMAYTRTTLRTGSTGAAVTALQKALKVTADGRFGSGTATAVKNVQGLYGLTRDGVVGAKSWRAIVAYASR